MIAQRHAAGLDREPWKKAQLEVVVDAEVPARAFLDDSRDIVLVVVRIEQDGDDNRGNDREANDGCRGDTQDLEESHRVLRSCGCASHGRILTSIARPALHAS